MDTLYPPGCPVCTISDRLYPDRPKVWKPVDARGPIPDSTDDWHQEAPTAFSFLSSKESALTTMSELRRIAEVLSTHPGMMISFNSDYCGDVGPLLVLSVMRGNDDAEIRLSGHTALPWRRVVSALGILGPPEVYSAEESEEVDFWPLPVERRTVLEDADGLCSEQFVCDKMCRKIDEWLNTNQMELTRRGRVDITKVFAELLDNAVAHANPNSTEEGDWHIGAFMGRRPSDDGKEYVFKCHIAFMSVGATIPESLEASTGDVRTRRDNYRKVCSTAGFQDEGFQCADAVFAMQDGVSRTENSGTGLIDMLDIVGKLGDTKRVAERNQAKVAIVTGGACLHIGRAELDKIRRPDSTHGRQLWLNFENSSDKPPQEQNAFNISPQFPGVMITLSFQIDAIQSSLNAEDAA